MPAITSSPYITVRHSAIAGTGVFARRRIPAGTRVIRYTGRRVTKREAERICARESEQGAVYVFQLNRHYDLDGSVRWNTARFINHSCAPNLESVQVGDRIWLEAMRDIRPGEELSYDYGFGPEDCAEHRCRCGAPDCRGYIVGERYGAKIRKQAAKAVHPENPAVN